MFEIPSTYVGDTLASPGVKTDTILVECYDNLSSTPAQTKSVVVLK